VAEARPHGVLVKVILETCYLTAEQIVAACRLAEEAGADFVKTSTGFGTGGATPEAVRTMLDAVGGRLGVKASGGIRSWEDAERYLDMGCTRLGVGDAAAILDGRPPAPDRPARP
jgi:deoxyribose-phosphate aldolase